MPSPFPGMNPYFEDTDFWRKVEIIKISGWSGREDW